MKTTMTTQLVETSRTICPHCKETSNPNTATHCGLCRHRINVPEQEIAFNVPINYAASSTSHIPKEKPEFALGDGVIVRLGKEKIYGVVTQLGNLFLRVCWFNPPAYANTEHGEWFCKNSKECNIRKVV